MFETLLITEKYFFWLVTYSIIGWIYECIVESIRQKKIVNRGFLNGPYCPIYGFGALLDVLVLGRIENPVILFLCSAILTCTLEFFTSVIMEKLFHARWWDYYDFNFNIDGRICLLGAMAFGTLSILLVKLIHPFMMMVTDKFSYPMFHFICIGLLLLVIIDSLFTVLSFSSFNNKLKELSSNIERIRNEFIENYYDREKHQLSDGESSPSIYERINAAYKNFVRNLNPQQFRIIKAFPRLRSITYSKLSYEIKKFIFRRKK